MTLILGEKYNVQLFGIAPRQVVSEYIGIMQQKTILQNEVHGFMTFNGILLVTQQEIENRVTNTSKN